MLSGELYAQRLQKLIYLDVSTDCFMKISLHSIRSSWNSLYTNPDNLTSVIFVYFLFLYLCIHYKIGFIVLLLLLVVYNSCSVLYHINKHHETHIPERYAWDSIISMFYGGYIFMPCEQYRTVYGIMKDICALFIYYALGMYISCVW